ncbi:MAG: HEAT repeat domain-containing protein [Candidatus Cloacimonetes bacterium]|nr:HEAT repeat domain-containing protein [Candidatus Cloacimonadota bacterium]
MMWKIADIGNEIFHDFFGAEDLNGKIIYFIEGEIEPKDYDPVNILADFSIVKSINPQKLTICFIDGNGKYQSLIVPLLGVLTPHESRGALAMKAQNISGFLRFMPESGSVEIYTGTNEGYIISFRCGNKKSEMICCKGYETLDEKSKAEISSLLFLKNEKGEYLDLSEYPSRKVRLLSLKDGRRYASAGYPVQLLKLLDDEDSLIRIRAAELLSKDITDIPDGNIIISLLKRQETEESKKIKRNLDDAIRRILDLIVKSADVDTITFLIKNAPQKHKELLGVNLSLIKGGSESEEVMSLLKGEDLINSFFAAQYIVNSCSVEGWQEVLDNFSRFDSYQRRRITADMCHNNPEVSFRLFTKNLKKSENERKTLFIEALRTIGSSKILPIIADYIESDSENVRSAAVWEIATMQHERYKGAFLIPKLNRIIENDPSPKIKVGAIKAVLRLKSDKSHDSVLNAVYDEDESVKNEALEGLGLLGTPDDVDVIAKYLVDKSPLVRVSALSTLQKIYEKYRGVDIDLYKDPFSEFGNEISKNLNPYLPEITALLCDDNVNARNRAVVIIRKWPAVFIINGLLECMKASDKPELQNNAIRILGEMYGPYSEHENSIGDVTEYLINGLSNDDPSIRNGCAQALGRRKDPCAAEELESLFMKPDECDQVKKTALWAYNNIMNYYNH